MSKDTCKFQEHKAETTTKKTNVILKADQHTCVFLFTRQLQTLSLGGKTKKGVLHMIFLNLSLKT